MPYGRKGVILTAVRQTARKRMAHDTYGTTQSNGYVRFVLAVYNTLRPSLRPAGKQIRHTLYGYGLGYDVLHVIRAEHVAELDILVPHGVFDPQFGSILLAQTRQHLPPAVICGVTSPVDLPI